MRPRDTPHGPLGRPHNRWAQLAVLLASPPGMAVEVICFSSLDDRALNRTQEFLWDVDVMQPIAGGGMFRNAAQVRHHGSQRAIAACASRVALLCRVKRIDDLHASLLEVRSIARRDGEPVYQGCRRNKAVLDRHRASRLAKCCEERRPSKTCRGVPRKTLHKLDTGIEPLLQLPSAPPSGQQQDAEANLAKDDRIDGDLAFVALQPLEAALIRRGLGRLAEHVGVNEKLHNVSVDSDSIGTKKSFSGHASSQSMTPAFGLGIRRTSRYSPRSTRSTSNSCPVSIRSRWRSSAGNTI